MSDNAFASKVDHMYRYGYRPSEIIREFAAAIREIPGQRETAVLIGEVADVVQEGDDRPFNDGVCDVCNADDECTCEPSETD